MRWTKAQKKAARDAHQRDRERVAERLTPEVRAELSVAQAHLLAAKATGGSIFRFTFDTKDALIEKGLLVRREGRGDSFDFTPRGARWAMRLAEIIGWGPPPEDARPARRGAWRSAERVARGGDRVVAND